MTSIFIRATLLVVFSIGISFGMAGHVDRVNAERAAHESVAARASTPIVELPEISVRPTAQDLADADLDATGASISGRPRFIRTLTLPTLGLDMPYYSFGKSRVSKE